jgi:MFS family permease
VSPSAEALARRDLRRLATLRGVSFLGDFAALTALFLRLAPHGSAAIAALAIAGALPLVLLAPLAGHVVDRTPAKALLSGLAMGEAFLCLGLAQWRGPAATLTLMTLLSCLVAFSGAGYLAMVPSLVGEERVAAAQGRLQAVQGVASVLGPVAGGLLVGAAGQGWPLLVDAASFALAAALTTSLRHDRRPTPGERVAGARGAGMTAGAALIARDAVMGPVLATTAVVMLSLGMINVAEVFFITRTLHGSATMYGLVGTCFGSGWAFGSLLAPRLGQTAPRLVGAFVVSVVALGAVIGGIGLVSSLPLVYPLQLAAGVGAGLATTCLITLFTVRSPEALRGRVFAAVSATTNGSELASMALGGIILTQVAPRTVFQIAGVACLAGATLFSVRAWRAARP